MAVVRQEPRGLLQVRRAPDVRGRRVLLRAPRVLQRGRVGRLRHGARGKQRGARLRSRDEAVLS